MLTSVGLALVCAVLSGTALSSRVTEAQSLKVATLSLGADGSSATDHAQKVSTSENKCCKLDYDAAGGEVDRKTYSLGFNIKKPTVCSQRTWMGHSMSTDCKPQTYGYGSGSSSHCADLVGATSRRTRWSVKIGEASISKADWNSTSECESAGLCCDPNTWFEFSNALLKEEEAAARHANQVAAKQREADAQRRKQQQINTRVAIKASYEKQQEVDKKWQAACVQNKGLKTKGDPCWCQTEGCNHYCCNGGNNYRDPKECCDNDVR